MMGQDASRPNVTFLFEFRHSSNLSGRPQGGSMVNRESPKWTLTCAGRTCPDGVTKSSTTGKADNGHGLDWADDELTTQYYRYQDHNPSGIHFLQWINNVCQFLQVHPSSFSTATVADRHRLNALNLPEACLATREVHPVEYDQPRYSCVFVYLCVCMG